MKFSTLKASMLAWVCLFSILCVSCEKSDDNPPNQAIQSGNLYYSAANELIRYDFSTRQETPVFSEGSSYSISPGALKFSWYENDFYNDNTSIYVHDLQSPGDYSIIKIPYILESTPLFSPNDELLGALARSADEPVNRLDLLLINYQGEVTGRIPHVKDFAFAPNGKDLIISAEAINSNGEAIGYALAMIKDYRSENSQQSITIHEFPDYRQLPYDIAVSANSSMLVFTYLDHLYTTPLEENSNLRQITDSRFKEADASWSPDGDYLVFIANITGPVDCEELRIVPSSPAEPVHVPDDGYDNEPIDPLQPVDKNGKVLHSCGSENIFWQE